MRKQEGKSLLRHLSQGIVGHARTARVDGSGGGRAWVLIVPMGAVDGDTPD